MILGLISDTHGLVRPEAATALVGSDQILHAGDIGGPMVLEALARIAPVIAVRGNVDEAGYLRQTRHSKLDPEWAAELPTAVDLELGGVRIHVTHDVATVGTDLHTDVLVVGHSHVPRIHRRHDMLVVNPGSAGPRRFELPISLGRLSIHSGAVDAELIDLGQ